MRLRRGMVVAMWFDDVVMCYIVLRANSRGIMVVDASGSLVSGMYIGAFDQLLDECGIVV